MSFFCLGLTHLSCSQETMMLYALTHGHLMPSTLQEHARYQFSLLSSLSDLSDSFFPQTATLEY